MRPAFGSLGAHRANDLFKKLGSTHQLRQLGRTQASDRCRQPFDPTRSPCSKNVSSFACSPDLRQPPVVRVIESLDKTILLQASHDACHRRRLHLLGRGELPQGERPAEDHDGEGRQARSRQPGGIVFLPQLAKEMNRGGVELVGERVGSLLRPPRCHSSGRRRCPVHRSRTRSRSRDRSCG